MNVIDAMVSFQLTLLLHATLLLGAAWLLERSGVLRNSAWAELAWRAALFGALLSAALSVLVPMVRAGAPGLLAVSSGIPNAAGTDDRANTALGDPAVGKRGPAQAPARASARGETDIARRPFPMDSADRTLALPAFATFLLGLPWAFALTLAGGRLAWQWRHLRRWARALAAHPASPSAEVVAQARRLAAELRLPHAPSLHRVHGLPSPMLLPGNRLLLPDWVDDLGATRQRALLAHELTHLQRRDPAWRIVQRLALVPLSLHPLAWIAVRRLEALAEDACDARAAELCGSGRPLAECLATCLTHAGRRAGPSPLAVAMADDSSQVVRRVRNLLEEMPMTRPIPPALRRTAIVLALAAAVALPGLAVTSIGNHAFAGSLFNWGEGSTHIETDGKDGYRYRHVRKDERVALAMRGRIEFAPDDTDILGMDPDARFDFTDTRDGTRRQLVVTVDQGKLARDYRVDGDTRPFDAAASAWLAERLPHLVRESGLNAGARGQRILATGGTSALLDEIGQIKAAHARRAYLQVLFEQATPDDAQMQRALEAVRGLGSDYERRLALSAALAGRTLSPARQAQLLGVAAGIGSDYEQAQLLRELAERQPLAGPVLAAWRDALETIGSDYEQRRVLNALLARGEPTATRLALESARSIASDYEARQLLVTAIPQVRADAGVRDEWFGVLSGIGSDYEQRKTLESLIAAGPVDIALAGAVLDSIDAIGSDFEATATLRELAAAMPADPGLIERYRTAARRLSDHERGKAEKALDRFASR